MIYLLVSRSIEVDGSEKVAAGTPLQIKVPGREAENHPIIGFETLMLAEEFLSRNKISRDEYRLILKDRRLSEDYNNQSIFLVENEAQLDQMENEK